MDIYVLKCFSSAEEYIKLTGDIVNIKIPILKSEIHNLSKEKIYFDISEEGVLEVPDVIYYEGAFLVSNGIKELMDINNVDYIFWKEAIIQSDRYGIHEKFWIIVPPKIGQSKMIKILKKI